MKASTYLYSLLVLLCACVPGEEEPPPVAVRATEVRIGPLREGISALGEVEPARQVKIVARLQGVVIELPVDEGGRASAGDELVRISTPDVAARLQRARAELARAEAERDHACGRAETDRRLGEAGDLPGDMVDLSAKACLSTTLAAEAASAGVREASEVAGRSSERAPFAGRVLAQLVDVGQSVMPGTPLAVYGSEELELSVRISEGDVAAGIWGGMPAEIELSEDAAIRAEVLSVGAWAQGPGRTVEVRVALPDRRDLLVGRRLDVIFIHEELEAASAVPEASLFGDGQAAWVYQLVGHRLQRVDVTPGPRRDGWVAVTPFLAAGTRVVVGTGEGLDASRAVLPFEVMP